VETAEPQPQGIADEQAAVAEPEATQKQEVAAEESATSEDAKKEAKPRRKSWLQDFLPFS
jgi:hypothetical protein